jgi:hypothetical protein
MRAASAFAKLSSNTVLATPGMALDLESLSLADPGNQASLASMPEELWRRIAAYLRPATTARAFVVASGRSSSLQKALRAEIEQTERALFGMIDNWASDEIFVRVFASGDREEILARVKKFTSSIMALHISTRTFRSRRDESPPDAAADEPAGGFEALARRLMLNGLI